MRELAASAKDLESLKALADDILSRIDKVDLKSYEFEKDPDLSFRHIWFISLKLIYFN